MNQTLFAYFLLTSSQACFKDCLAKEKQLELYSDSDSVEEAKKKKAIKRRHPVNSISSTLNLFDLTSDFKIVTGMPPLKKYSKILFFEL